VAEALLASYQRQLDAAVPGHLRIAGTRAPADPDRVAALEAEGQAKSTALVAIQVKARELAQARTGLAVEADSLRAAVAPTRTLVPA